MASLSTDKAGNRTIQFIGGDGRRRSIRLTRVLGKISKKTASEILTKVAALNAAAIAKLPWDNELASWVAKLDAKLYNKLADFDLVPKRQAAPKATLAPFLAGYLAARTDVKGSTATAYGHTRRCLVDFFGPDKPLSDITFSDAEKFRRWLATHRFARKQGGSGNRRLSDSTIRRRCSIARQFFNEAADSRLVADNPFRKLKGIGVKANRSRDHFISREDAAKVLDACPDAEWRLIFALSRYGGLRCPSEHLSLRWGDVDWVRGRLTVHVPKLEHHGEDYATREIPLFPELRRYFDEAFAVAGERGLDPTEYVISRYRGAGVNLRTQLERIIAKAKLKPWPKLFQNLRATRQTELASEYPEHVVCRWIGNSQAVAKKHYLQVTDADFERAATASEPEALHKAVQQESASDCTDQQGVQRFLENPENGHMSSDFGATEWARQDSNLGPQPYQGCALTN
jgi:integrase